MTSLRRITPRIAFTALALVMVSCTTSTSDGDPTKKRSGNQSTSAATGKAGASSVEIGDATAGLSQKQRAHLLDDAETTWDVTLSDDTTLVADDGLAALQSTEGDDTFVFDADKARSAGLDLTEGRVLLVAGRALGRITGSTSGGGTVTVTTEPASLADAIAEGTVGWDVPLTYDFEQFVTEPVSGGRAARGSSGSVKPSSADADHATPRLQAISMAMPDGRRVPVVSADEDPGSELGVELGDIDIKVKPDDGAVEWTVKADDNKYQFRITAKGETADFLVVVSRGGDDPTMAYRGEGTVGALRSSSSSSFSGGEVAGSRVGLDNLDAKVKLSASVAGAGVSPLDLKVPVPMLTFIWMVGPIPVTVDVKANIIGTVEATSKASATAKAAFSYRGDAGFSFDGGTISGSGSTEIDSLDPEPADSAAPMGIDVDAQFGVAFPEVSLSLFDQGFVPSIHFGAAIGSNLTWGAPRAGFPASSICKSGYVRAEVVGKYDFKILGQSLASGEHEFWKDRRDAQSDGCDKQQAAD